MGSQFTHEVKKTPWSLGFVSLGFRAGDLSAVAVAPMARGPNGGRDTVATSMDVILHGPPDMDS
ncbi:MAG: hypothetical protein CMM01_16700 [Rhodopirellula sp.]|nr:hypothetical protein [Rhodopirellula sp.]